MGLDISHDGPHWSYYGFQVWRQAVIEAAGIPTVKHQAHDRFKQADLDFRSYPEHYFYGEWPEGEPADPIMVLIVHSDCGGAIYPVHAAPLADRIEGLMDKLEPYHADAAGDFIAALRRAARAGEPLQFY